MIKFNKISDTPLFSVIIDTFYRPKMLHHAVDQILNQSYKKIELIIVNNGATHETIDYIRNIKQKDNRIKVVDFEQNQFSWDDPQMLVRICYNAGLKIATGELVFYQSDDDWVELDFVQKMVNLFLNNKNCISAIGRVVNAKPDGTIISYYPINKREVYLDGKTLAIDFATNRKLTQENPGHSFVFIKEVLIELGGYKDTFELQQIFGIVPFGLTGFDSTALMYWGRHPEQLNAKGTKRYFYWDSYLLNNLEKSGDSFIDIWKDNFSKDDSEIVKFFCVKTIYTGFYQIFFTLLFQFRITEAYKFHKKYYNRIKKYSLVHNSKKNGLIEAIKRSKLYYILNLFTIFSNNFFKSPRKTIIRLNSFIIKKFSINCRR